MTLLQKISYVHTITEEAMRISNRFQKQAGVVKGDFPYDQVVAMQFKAASEQ